MSKKKAGPGKEYIVLIPVRNDATGAAFDEGDVVTAADFPDSVIAEWLKNVPPVLEPKEADDGSDS
jgi:hypothetical protein